MEDMTAATAASRKIRRSNIDPDLDRPETHHAR
jgi:hypothetical protein